VRGNSVWQWWP